MSTKFAISLCDSNDRANTVLESFLDTCTKFDCVDVLGGSRYANNFYKNNVKSITDLNILRSQFMLSYNMHIMSCYVEEATDLPKGIAYNQNLAEVNNIVVVCNGTILNKEYMALQYETSMGQSNQELIANLYIAAMKKGLKEDTFPSIIRDIEAYDISFAIYDKQLSQIYVYNRGESLYMRNIPGMELVLFSEILPTCSSYPHYNFHKLPNNCAIKIDTKTMYVQYIPMSSNIFSFGKNVLIDNNRALLFTEACDMEHYVALSLLTSDKNVFNGLEVQPIYFGFDSEVDTLIVDKLNKLRKSIVGATTATKIPLHMKYTFDNIYKNESEAIDAANVEKANNDSTIPSTKDGATTKKKKLAPPNLRQSSMFLNRKINYIASTLVNYAIENGYGTIFVPNLNRHNIRLINTIKSIVDRQTVSPIFVYSILDQYNMMDLIRYIFVCKELPYKDVASMLIHSDRNSIGIGYNDKNERVYTFNASSDYNNDTICAFSKCGIDNPFSDRYVGKYRINNQLINADLTADKLFDNQMKATFINTITNITKSHVELQRKIQSF